MISRQKFKNVSNFTENSRKEFRKFMGNSRGPTDVISRCCTIANKEILEQRIFTTLSQDSRVKRVNVNYLGGRRGVVVTRLIQSAKLLYAGPG